MLPRRSGLRGKDLPSGGLYTIRLAGLRRDSGSGLHEAGPSSDSVPFIFSLTHSAFGTTAISGSQEMNRLNDYTFGDVVCQILSVDFATRWLPGESSKVSSGANLVQIRRFITRPTPHSRVHLQKLTCWLFLLDLSVGSSPQPVQLAEDHKAWYTGASLTSTAGA